VIIGAVNLTPLPLEQPTNSTPDSIRSVVMEKAGTISCAEEFIAHCEQTGIQVSSLKTDFWATFRRYTLPPATPPPGTAGAPAGAPQAHRAAPSFASVIIPPAQYTVGLYKPMSQYSDDYRFESCIAARVFTDHPDALVQIARMAARHIRNQVIYCLY
jgi:hypothetical protein